MSGPKIIQEQKENKFDRALFRDLCRPRAVHRAAISEGARAWQITLEKAAMMADGIGGNPGSVVTQPFWWAVYLHACWFAFRVEQERRKMPAAPDVSVFN